MKLNFDENFGAATTYSAAGAQKGCPEFVRRLLELKELQSVFVCQDFITLNKDPRADWEQLLNSASAILTGAGDTALTIARYPVSPEGDREVQVLVQTFRFIPIQVKVIDSQGETRVSLSTRFIEAAQFIQGETKADFLKERHWVDHGRRYGSRDEVAREIADEIEGSCDEPALEQAKAQALGAAPAKAVPFEDLRDWLQHKDWQRRLAAVNELGRSTDSPDSLELLLRALKDEHPQVRRLAAATLGATANTLAVATLCETMLSDQSVAVRRTAGDALSDIACPSAESAACRALADANRLVRWRAARLLSDLGTQEALPFLEQSVNDSAYEVRLEVESAIKRINAGAGGLGSAWRRIAEQQ
jgi:3-methyladenine DNA glycosylase AlkD